MVLPSAADAKGEIAAGAFAGVEAGGRAIGTAEWENSGAMNTATQEVIIPSKWTEVFSVGATAAVNAGAGAEARFKISYENGKFIFRCEARLVWGIGAKGGLTGTVGFAAIFDFVVYVYHQLKDNNFSYLDFMDESGPAPVLFWSVAHVMRPLFKGYG